MWSTVMSQYRHQELLHEVNNFQKEKHVSYFPVDNVM